MLEAFCLASGLVINWTKSSGYWKSHDTIFRPDWTNYLGVTWAEDEEVSKLLGAPFELSLTSGDVDKFLYDKISKKLLHWSTQKINPTGRVVVANTVLISAMFFFLSIWGGTVNGVKKIKGLVMHYLASGTMQRARVRVSWLQCCQMKEKGGLDLINPEDAMTSLMVKWMVKAMEPGTSNLHLLLRHRLNKYQPYAGGNWKPSLDFFTLRKHQSHRGSATWNRVTSAWKKLNPEIIYNRPTNIDEWLCTSLWFCPAFSMIGPSFSKQRANNLHKQGMRYYRDIWIQNGFMDYRMAQEKYGILGQESGTWETMVQGLWKQWADIIKQPPKKAECGEWVGVFGNTEDNTPTIICPTSTEFQPPLGLCTIEVPAKTNVYVPSNNLTPYLTKVSEETRTLTMSWDRYGESTVNKYSGFIRRVRVASVVKGPKKKKSYYTMAE